MLNGVLLPSISHSIISFNSQNSAAAAETKVWLCIWLRVWCGWLCLWVAYLFGWHSVCSISVLSLSFVVVGVVYFRFHVCFGYPYLLRFRCCKDAHTQASSPRLCAGFGLDDGIIIIIQRIQWSMLCRQFVVDSFRQVLVLRKLINKYLKMKKVKKSKKKCHTIQNTEITINSIHWRF